MERCRWYSITGREEILRAGDSLGRRPAAQALLTSLFRSGPRVNGASPLADVSPDVESYRDYTLDDGVFAIWFRVNERDCELIVVMAVPSGSEGL